MPFDLFLSRATTFAEHAAPASPIAAADFHAIYASMRAKAVGEHAYRVPRAEDAADAWFVASWRPPGLVVLSTSYSHPRFLRNFPDLFDHGLAVAGKLSARLFEEVGGTEVTSQNIDALLAPDGEYVSFQAKMYHHVIDQMSSESRAPLDYPIGPIDLVGEYFVFHVTPARRVDLPTTSRFLEARVRGASSIQAAPNALCLVDASSRRWLTKVLFRPDTVQVWPAWGQSPFGAIAAATVSAAEIVKATSAGSMTFDGQPCDEALLAEIHRRRLGGSADFYAWTTTLGANPG